MEIAYQYTLGGYSNVVLDKPLGVMDVTPEPAEVAVALRVSIGLFTRRLRPEPAHVTLGTDG
jgi:hypothetical protein